MKITKLKETDKLPFNVDGRRLCSNDNIEIIHLTLRPGEKINWAKNSTPVVFYMIEGTGLFETEMGQILVKQGSCVEIGTSEKHIWKNISAADVFLLAINIHSK